MRPYKGMVTHYDDEDTQTRWGRKSARRLLRVALSLEILDAVVEVDKHEGNFPDCPICYTELYGRRFP